MTSIETNEKLQDNVTEPSKPVQNESNSVVMSKNQLKKKAKLERKLQGRVEKRKKEREARKLKRKVQLAMNDSENLKSFSAMRKLLKKNRMQDSTNKQRICIDLSFENLMSDSDLSHLCKQLGFCYAANRRLKQPIQFYLTDYKTKTKAMLERLGGNNWDIFLNEQNYMDLFKDDIEKGNVCYLTSDSPNELDDFDENKVYIIGGLVDHNHHKSLCYNIALKNNLKHYHLPINKYMHMKTRQVLTVNQIFEIICKYVECKNWQEAFMSVLPKRKGAKCVIDDNEEESTDNKDTDVKVDATESDK